MKLFARLALILLPVLLPGTVAHGQFASQVDPLLGVSGGGSVFPGPAVPFGIIKPGPDMVALDGNDANAGWNEGGNILGFSQTHVSGTGGGAKYGNVLVTPTTDAISRLDAQSPSVDEKASAGFYAVRLKRYGVGVEITATRRAAIYRFNYPSGTPANLLFDAGHCLRSSFASGEAQSLRSAEIHIVSSTEVSGSTSVTGGWNKQSNTYTVYFYAVMDTPAITFGTWLNGKQMAGAKSAQGKADSSVGAWFSFGERKADPVLMKIGISFISAEQARRNLMSEIPGFGFDAVHAAAVAAWDKALSAVELKGETPEQAKMFYTAIYHAMLMPTDRTGENPLWNSSEPYYDDFYAIWDTFRTSGPLLTIIAPRRESDIVRALVDIYRHEGWLPDARSGNYTGRTQGGSNADFLITDAFMKGLKGVDWNTALSAEIHDAEIPPEDNLREGRGGLNDWHKLGYVSVEGSDRTGSVDMEYAADDFEIALLAKGLGQLDIYKKYLERSGNWNKLWDASLTEDGFSGFIRPRHRDGSWLTPFTAMDECTWGGSTFYEGNSWTYSFFVPQDVASLIDMAGGPQTFVRRLDAFFAVPGRYDVGNEPGFLAPYLYIWAGRPDKTDEHVRAIIAKSYHAGLSGLPGNDDSGAMSSWYAFGQMGIFPNAGQDVYLIGSPAYPKTILHLADGKNFVIEARNLAPDRIYVTAATLNNKTLDRAWLRHSEIAAGGRLVLTMASAPTRWAEHNLPPSTPSVH